MSRGALLPGSTVGILGGGQLGRMLALEARRMGYRTVVLDADPHGPAAQVADRCIAASLDDLHAVRELGRRSDVVTLEWENADLEACAALEEIRPLHPGAQVLAVAQHRLREKEGARRVGLATAGFHPVRSADDLREGVRRLGTPALLKTCRGGYDGRGQRRIGDAEEVDAAFAELSALEPELILEEWIPFRLEISVITARTATGEMTSFPVGENAHRGGILDTTVVPARISDTLAAKARGMAEAFAESLGVVGLLAVEMFVDAEDRILVNEIAPRPHNSGHYSWEACATSQFEQHLRAVCGLPLGSTELLRPAAMVNLLGEDVAAGLDGTPAALAEPGVALHLYGKAEARPGRKMGHLTALGASAEEALAAARAAKRALAGA